MKSLTSPVFLLFVLASALHGQAQESAPADGQTLARYGKKLHASWRGDAERTAAAWRNMEELDEFDDSLAGRVAEKAGDLQMEFRPDGTFAMAFGEQRTSGTWKAVRLRKQNRFQVLEISTSSETEFGPLEKNLALFFLDEQHILLIDPGKRDLPFVLKKATADVEKVPCSDGFMLDSVTEIPVGVERASVRRVVILVPGSGTHSMEMDLTSLTRGGKENRFFRDLGETLTGAGLAVVRYNKRNYQLGQMQDQDDAAARSEFVAAYRKNPLRFQVDDLLDVVEFTRDRLPAADVYLLGHGNGAYIALQASDQNDRIRGAAFIGFTQSPADVNVFEQTVYTSLSLFHQVDTDGNGKVEGEEFEQESPLARAFQRSLAWLDFDADQAISRSEFQAGNYVKLVLADSLAAVRAQEARYPRAGEILQQKKIRLAFFHGLRDTRSRPYQTMAIHHLHNRMKWNPDMRFHYFEGLGHLLDVREGVGENEYETISQIARERIGSELDEFFRSETKTLAVTGENTDCQMQVSVGGDSITGEVAWTVETRGEGDTLDFHLAREMEVTGCTVNGAEAAWSRSQSVVAVPLPKSALSGELQIQFAFAGTPYVKQRQRKSGFVRTSVTADLAYIRSQYAWYPRPATGNGAGYQTTIQAPGDWGVRTAGKLVERTADGDREFWTFRSSAGQRPIGLVAGPYAYASRPVGEKAVVDVMVFAEHEESASRLLDLAQPPFLFYSTLFGELDGSRFSLVEMPAAFGRTSGYGEAGYALIGTGVFERPSSPWAETLVAHEVAHSWWGQEVAFKNFAAEAFATYAANRFTEATRGSAAAAAERGQWKDALFRTISTSGEVDLNEIRNYGAGLDPAVYRYHAYEKAALILHMLETEMGRPEFDERIRRFFKKHRGEVIDFAVVQAELADDDNRRVFEQWSRTGIPSLQCEFSVEPAGPGFRVTGTLRQQQTEAACVADVELDFSDGTNVKRHRIKLEKINQSFELDCDFRPLRVAIDSENRTLFRTAN